MAGLESRFRLLRRGSADESGATLIEFAVTFTVMMCFFFTLMETCLLLYSDGLAAESAREGTHYAIYRGSTCKTGSGSSCTTSSSSVNSYVTSLNFPNPAKGTLTVNTTYPDGDEAPGHRASVQVTYVFKANMPFVSTKSFTLQSTSVMDIVQ
jgi:hypothetical protein